MNSMKADFLEIIDYVIGLSFVIALFVWHGVIDILPAVIVRIAYDTAVVYSALWNELCDMYLETGDRR